MDKTNTKIYGEHKSKLTNEQKKEIYFASSAGGLCSTIHDLQLLSEATQTYLNKESLDILKSSSMCFTEGDDFSIKSIGTIYGSETLYIATYNKHWKLKNLEIKM